MSRSYAGVGSPLQAGTQTHVLVQERIGESDPSYRKEVAVAARFETDALILELGGRIDGVYAHSDGTLLEEIKATGSVHALRRRIAEDPFHPYVLQVRTYAYMYWHVHGVVPRCRLLLVSLHDHEDLLQVGVDFDPHAFGAWFESRQLEWRAAEAAREARQALRHEAGLRLEFPFDQPRTGQIELLKRVERTVHEQRILVAQAPTGLGKTAGVLFPALQDALLRGRQVFYITPKNSQHRVALDTVKRMRAQGSQVRAGIIASKEKTCLKEETVCDPSYCEFARGYYDKVNDHELLDVIEARGAMSPEDYAELARAHEVCPFELSLDATERLDVVICDYNYVFSPRAALARYFEEDVRTSEINLVIDEAHNLYARAQEEHSPTLSIEALNEAVQPVVETLLAWEPKIARRGESLIAKAIDCIESCRPEVRAPSAVVTLDPREFYKIEQAFGRLLTRYAQARELIPPSDPLVRLYNYWFDFCAVLRLGGDEFVTTYRNRDAGDEVQITCCDASRFLSDRMEKFSSVIAFSATIKPFDFYAALTGLTGPRLETAEFSSPFPRENRKILVIPQVSTLYRERERHVGKIAEAIDRIVTVRKGNYFVFFPSFEFLEAVRARVTLEGFRVYAQTRGMAARDANALLGKFEQKTKNVVIFGVQGGVFSEGIDCPGDDLIGAIVVGPALPAYRLERECMRQYYDRKYGRGYDFAYTFPAMARVIQAAGRVIRTETDRGLIVLMDRRFVDTPYSAVMPQGWFDASVRELVSSSILKEVSAFWEEAPRAVTPFEGGEEQAHG